MISGKNETTQVHKEMKKVVITGGAGFIGTNMADRLARMGVDVLLFDNLSRAGSDKNLEWILHTHKGRVKFMHADIRDPNAIRTAITDASVIYHFAGQVAVTTSIEDPVGDFETNMHGTFLLLEAIRTYG
jgi:CDP-paratose 2-epimerase